MCLSASTSRKPLFSTAYKIIENFNGIYRSPFIWNPIDINSKDWIVDDMKTRIRYENISAYYSSGFHSFINLSDAISKIEYFITLYHNEFYIFEVDTDDILEYGVERQKDVVVSRKIKFIQRIM